MSFVTRFAPSPTGFLHKGHALSACLAYEATLAHGGRFLLRIEDIDTSRLRAEFVEAIYEDLAWLGLRWETPVRRQSAHLVEYQVALSRLKDMGLVYPCFCTRKDIVAEIEAAGGAPHGPDGPVYPGICRNISEDERAVRIKTEPHAWRLNMVRATEVADEDLWWEDEHRGPVRAAPARFGDVVLARKDTPTSYHLAVVHDDAHQGVSHIIRGEDLFDHTDIHVLLQRLLGYPTPCYRHHRLLMGPDGKRLAKRNKAATLRDLRARHTDAAALKSELLQAAKT